MTKKRRSLENLNTPSQEDEADILAEAGAKPDENGELVVDEETVLKLGAVDVESIRENRRLEQVAAKKTANIPGVSFNTDDPIVIFDTISKSWGPNSFHINVKRLTGTPVQDVITSLPRSGMELLAALKDFHVQKGDPHAEATYEVKFRDAGNKQIRGTGRITIPAVRPQPGQGTMNAPQYPPYGAPPYYGAPPPVAAGYPQPPAVAQYPQGAPPQPAPTAPQQPPSVHVMPQPGPDPMAMMQQMFGMFRQMQESFAAQSQPQQQPQPQMPPPPQGTDPGAMMGWMQQFFQMFQQMQAQNQPPPSRRGEPTQHPQQPQMNPMMGMMGSMMPPVQTPPGMMWIPGLGFAPIDRVAQLFSAPSSGPGSGFRPAHRPPYEGGPSQYGPGSGQHYPPQPPAAQRSLTPAEQFREAISVVRTAVSAVEEFRDLVPQAGESHEAPVVEEDDSPVKVMDTGKGKILFDKKEGSIRGWETFWANMPELLKWGGEQVEVIRKSHAEQQRAQQPQQQQLPPGYVEVTPGYQPPPGYVAVPVEPTYQPSPQPPQGGLPPPPASMPPPIQSTPAPKRTWEAPVIPPTEGEGY